MWVRLNIITVWPSGGIKVEQNSHRDVALLARVSLSSCRRRNGSACEHTGYSSCILLCTHRNFRKKQALTCVFSPRMAYISPNAFQQASEKLPIKRKRLKYSTDGGKRAGFSSGENHKGWDVKWPTYSGLWGCSLGGESVTWSTSCEIDHSLVGLVNIEAKPALGRSSCRRTESETALLAAVLPPSFP